MADEIDKILNDEKLLEETVNYVFKEADVDGNETIDAKEFHKHMVEVYENIGLKVPSDADIESYMTELDTNKDGKLDRSEFKAHVINMLKKDKENSSN
mmetsp:Transcript_24443/g.28110  ORF Transcript_24443/g.28110 Transcript_24443/m.28110 type:complete len:98 (-) Transcript_24443:41-334(-)|eukprot:CAMPEP_0168335890 /NCGR_PEP_ID=MMETSP0213-20121227/11193_1 /TAXON_ID=151035 /ORGANISM="Euplotes harpa, Strain FSP1.4" /LENGTH=97 /DNA_ID=CAMNT_0008340933 /DNA_START=53 /DNA_END=346 /DNA_ORIENTATION=+